jgi:P2 family phage contractile tail tube protein
MAVKINKLTNANIYIDGNSLLGKAEEIELPMIQHVMAEHKALGLVGKMEFFSGVDIMTAKIKWNSFYEDVLKKIANPTQAVKLQVRSSLEEWNSGGRVAELPVVAYITAASKDYPGGNFKQQENVEVESNLTVYYFKLEINGAPIIELDVAANIYKVAGADILATYRANLGI